MYLKIKERVMEEANYIITTKNTIRQASSFFNRSKSTIHKDLHDRLKKIDFLKNEQITKIFQEHISIRHINGGEATKKKYLKRSD